MRVISRLADLLKPTTYESVETYASRRGVNVDNLKREVKATLTRSGKVEAIRQVNRMLGEGKALPLPSTKLFVDSVDEIFCL